MEMLAHDKEWFKQFISEEYASIDRYIEIKSRDGIWADNVEIQILSEIYQANIEIYMPKRQDPIITRNLNNVRTIKVSYHQGSHYNSLIPIDATGPKDWIHSDTVGELEAIVFARMQVNDEECNDADSQMEEEAESSEYSKQLALARKCPEMIAKYREAVEESRSNFIKSGMKDLDIALEESLKSYNHENNEEEEKKLEDKVIEESKKAYEKQQMEDEIMQQVINDSLNANSGMNSYANNPNLEDEQLQAALLASQMENSYGGINRGELASSPVVVNLVSQGKVYLSNFIGFNEEEVIKAALDVGADEDAILARLLASQMANFQ